MASCNFDRAAGAATRLLLAQRLHSLSFDVAQLRYDRAVRFDTMQNFCATTRTTLEELTSCSDTRDGLTLRRGWGGQVLSIVLYNQEARNPRRRNFTLAHEIGHIYLDHLDDSDIQEAEANHFAAQLLLPRILVEEFVRRWEGPLAPADLCGVFKVSQEAAKNRLRSLSIPRNYTGDDHALLRKFGGLLPQINGPLITI